MNAATTRRDIAVSDVGGGGVSPKDSESPASSADTRTGNLQLRSTMTAACHAPVSHAQTRRARARRGTHAPSTRSARIHARRTGRRRADASASHGRQADVTGAR